MRKVRTAECFAKLLAKALINRGRSLLVVEEVTICHGRRKVESNTDDLRFATI